MHGKKSTGKRNDIHKNNRIIFNIFVLKPFEEQYHFEIPVPVQKRILG